MGRASKNVGRNDKDKNHLYEVEGRRTNTEEKLGKACCGRGEPPPPGVKTHGLIASPENYNLYVIFTKRVTIQWSTFVSEGSIFLVLVFHRPLDSVKPSVWAKTPTFRFSFPLMQFHFLSIINSPKL